MCVYVIPLPSKESEYIAGFHVLLSSASTETVTRNWILSYLQIENIRVDVQTKPLIKEVF